MPRMQKSSAAGGWLFLAVVLTGYALSFFLIPDST